MIYRKCMVNAKQFNFFNNIKWKIWQCPTKKLNISVYSCLFEWNLLERRLEIWAECLDIFSIIIYPFGWFNVFTSWSYSFPEDVLFRITTIVNMSYDAWIDHFWILTDDKWSDRGTNFELTNSNCFSLCI